MPSIYLMTFPWKYMMCFEHTHSPGAVPLLLLLPLLSSDLSDHVPLLSYPPYIRGFVTYVKPRSNKWSCDICLSVTDLIHVMWFLSCFTHFPAKDIASLFFLLKTSSSMYVYMCMCLMCVYTRVYMQMCVCVPYLFLCCFRPDWFLDMCTVQQ